MSNDMVGIDQKGKELFCYGRELRRFLDILVGDSVNFDEVLTEPTVSFGRTHQPLPFLDEFTIDKYGHSGGTNTGVRMISRLKIQTGDFHGGLLLIPVGLNVVLR